MAFAAPPDRFDASAWPAADKLFRGDPCWVGGDGAYSVELGKGRILWMFGDSLIDPTGSHSRKVAGVKMIGNSIAIQTGSDPSTANIRFYWRTALLPHFSPIPARTVFGPAAGFASKAASLFF